MTSPLRTTALDAHRAGRLDEAERLYRAALDDDPHDADALHLLGLVRDRAGSAQEGETLIRRAIAIRDEAVYNLNLGTLLLRIGRPEEAEAAYRHALTIRADLMEAAGRLGAMLLTARRFGEADEVLTMAVRHVTPSVELLNLLGVARMESGDPDGAESAWREALALAPTMANLHYNLGTLLSRSERRREAEACFRTAIASQPQHVDAHYNLGTLLLAEHRIAEARDAFETAATLHPEHGEALFNLGLVQHELGELGAAEASFRRVPSGSRSSPDARLSLAGLLLQQGRWNEGLALYEARYDTGLKNCLVPLPDLPFPQWQGEDLEGKSLLIWHEQGLGDSIQNARYAALLKARGARYITLCCLPPLARLFESVAGVDAIITGGDVPAHNLWTLPFSIPLHLAIDVSTIPANIPYLHVPPERTIVGKRLSVDGFRVGLAWRGAPSQSNNERRSLPGLATLSPLWSVAGISFVSLQKGDGEAEAQRWAAEGRLVACGSHFEDMADTAAVIDQLDLVISVCTSVAHLAGALGKACWVLLPAKGADWRWLEDRSDSPWYPGVMRLFRQERDGDWSNVIRDVTAALATLTAGAPTSARAP